MKMKILLLLSIIMFQTLYGISHCQESYECEISFLDESTSKTLKQTQITPTLEEKINTNENLIFYSGFPMTWNEIKEKYFLNTTEIENLTKCVDKTNDNFNHLIGTNEIKVLSNITKKFEFNEKFEPVEPILMNFNNENFYASAYGINIPFEYNDLIKQVDVKYCNVLSLDSDHYRAETNEIYKPKGVIISLLTKSQNEEIIISTIPVSNSLYDSFNLINQIIFIHQNKKLPSYLYIGYLAIPKLNLNIFNKYKGSNDIVLSSNKSKNDNTSNQHICLAGQKISINIDQETMVRLSSNDMYCGSGAYLRCIIIKCPFIIYMKNKLENKPYFIAYINNRELLQIDNSYDNFKLENVIKQKIFSQLYYYTKMSKDKLSNYLFIYFPNKIANKLSIDYINNLINEFLNSNIISLRYINNLPFYLLIIKNDYLASKLLINNELIIKFKQFINLIQK